MSSEISKTAAKFGRTPSMLASLLVVGVMIALILLSAVFFGGNVAKGPLQVSLTLATLFAVLVSHFHGGLSCSPDIGGPPRWWPE